MKIVRAQNADFHAVAKLHCESIPGGFLSALGADFLAVLYRLIQCESGAVVYVAKEDEQVAGFIAGAADTRRMYNAILFRSWQKLLPHLLMHMVNPKSIFKMVQTVLYGFSERQEGDRSVAAELLSIAVHSSARGKHLGCALVTELEQFMRENSVRIYKVVTFSEDRISNRFYLSCGFEFTRSFSHHGNIMNEYLKGIS